MAVSNVIASIVVRSTITAYRTARRASRQGRHARRGFVVASAANQFSSAEQEALEAAQNNACEVAKGQIIGRIQLNLIRYCPVGLPRGPHRRGQRRLINSIRVSGQCNKGDLDITISMRYYGRILNGRKDTAFNGWIDTVVENAMKDYEHIYKNVYIKSTR